MGTLGQSLRGWTRLDGSAGPNSLCRMKSVRLRGSAQSVDETRYCTYGVPNDAEEN